MVERDKIDTTNAQLHDLLAWNRHVNKKWQS